MNGRIERPRLNKSRRIINRRYVLTRIDAAQIVTIDRHRPMFQSTDDVPNIL